MSVRIHIPSLPARLAREERGAALVEFAFLLPILLLLFAVIFDGGRMMWSYQTAISGVRDATRYLARTAPLDMCQAGYSGPAIGSHAATLQAIVQNSIQGNTLFPGGITVNSVTPTLNCVTGTFRISPTPVAQVQANMTITFLFSGIFSFVGSPQPSITTTVTDQSRVFGV